MPGKRTVHETSTEDILGNYNKFYEDHYFQAWPKAMLTRADEVLPRVAWAKAWLEQHQGSEVLDLGCLDGFALTTLAATGHLFHGTGVELSLDGVALARENARSLGLDTLLDFHQGSIEEMLPRLEESGQQYDAVLLFEVIEHLKDPKQVLERIHKVLSPGGEVLISTPDWGGHFGESDFDHNHAHLRIYTHKDEAQGPDAPSLPELAREVGGTVLENEVWNDLIHLSYTVG